MPKKTIESVDVASKRVLIRLDLNVPMDGGSVSDDRRIGAALPTIRNVIDRGGRAVLMSHLGRPAGTGFEPGLSLKPVAEKLSELLGKPVAFPSNDCVDAAANEAVQALGNGELVLLENLRFQGGEKTGDPILAGKLAAHADVYVNDAFGTCHRSDASMVAVPKTMEGKPRVIGFLVEKEIKYLSEAMTDPARPFVVVLGGAKVADKLGAVEHLLPKADAIVIGGAMAYAFCAALGQKTGKSRVESDRIADAKRIIDEGARLDADLYLPSDHVCSTQFAQFGGDIEVFDQGINEGFMGMDIGPKTQTDYVAVINAAKTIVWNGPMGVYEWIPFRIGTQQIAKAIADATANGATSIVCGGDTAAAAEKFGMADKFSHISTGGGASLAMLEGKAFEAVDLLDEG